MDCPKMSAGAVAAFPDDPLVEILSRVPAKSVCRFKCVSKAWRDLIADPHHRKKLPQAMQGLFCMTPEFSEAVVRGSFRFSFIDLMMVRSVPLDIDPCFSFLTELPEIQILVFNDSCNGLILFEHQDPHSGSGLGYIVCNPTTKQWGAVPACHSVAQITCTCLAFDPAVSSHFHLVQFQVGEDNEFISVRAYSSETGTWSHNQTETGKQEEQGQPEGWHLVRFSIGDLCSRCPFVNGFLHLLVSDADELKIVALDVQGKARRMITVPGVHDMNHWLCHFGQSQGHLHCMTQGVSDTHEGSYKLSVWVLQDYDTGEWVLKDTVDSLEFFGKIAYRGCTKKLEFEVVDIHRDCDVVLLNHPLGHTLIAYDMGRKEAGAIATFEYPERLYCTEQYVPYFAESPILTNKQ